MELHVGGGIQRGGFLGLALVLMILLLPELALSGYFTIGALLASPAVTPRHADVVIVLGGGDGPRYVRGRELILAGYSKRLLLINPVVSELEDARRLRAVELRIDNLPGNSWQEAQAGRAWMEAYGWRSALIVSDPPHLLRVCYAWASIFRTSALTFFLVASDPPWWSAWRWWRDPQSEDFVSSEVLKLGYYIVRYRFGFGAEE